MKSYKWGRNALKSGVLDKCLRDPIQELRESGGKKIQEGVRAKGSEVFQERVRGKRKVQDRRGM